MQARSGWTRHHPRSRGLLGGFRLALGDGAVSLFPPSPLSHATARARLQARAQIGLSRGGRCQVFPTTHTLITFIWQAHKIRTRLQHHWDLPPCCPPRSLAPQLPSGGRYLPLGARSSQRGGAGAAGKESTGGGPPPHLGGELPLPTVAGTPSCRSRSGGGTRMPGGRPARTLLCPETGRFGPRSEDSGLKSQFRASGADRSLGPSMFQVEPELAVSGLADRDSRGVLE